MAAPLCQRLHVLPRLLNVLKTLHRAKYCETYAPCSQASLRTEAPRTRCTHRTISVDLHNSNPLLNHTNNDFHWLIYQPIRMAGHSHWQNIRHIKGAKDAKKMKDIIRIKERVRQAIKSGGGTDPKMNRDLERVFEEGKSYNIPLTAMMNVVKKLSDPKEQGVECVIEAMGVGNCHLMIECFTSKVAHVRRVLQGTMRKTGGTIVDRGRAANMFDHKGVLYVPLTDEFKMDLDDATEKAIECGAEEVTLGFTDNEEECLKFVCDKKELHQVKQSLTSMQVPVQEYRLEYIPHTFVQLKENLLQDASKMLDALEDTEDVIRVYDNIQSEDVS